MLISTGTFLFRYDKAFFSTGIYRHLPAPTGKVNTSGPKSHNMQEGFGVMVKCGQFTIHFTIKKLDFFLQFWHIHIKKCGTKLMLSKAVLILRLCWHKGYIFGRM